MKIAVYPGSFDPITNGHLDIIFRTAGLFDQLIVAVLNHPDKRPLFSVSERMTMIQDAVQACANVTVDSFSGLLVEFVRLKNAASVIRGVRDAGDLESELRMAHMNRTLNSNVLTLFVPTETSLSYVSSSLIKDVARNGGDIRSFVPAAVEEALCAKFRNA